MEIQILEALQKIHTPVLDKIMIGFTSLGNSGILWIVLAVILLCIPKTRMTGAVMAAALILDLILCNGILKNLVARTRPYAVSGFSDLLIAKPHDYSFPSGHAAASFSAVTALFMCRQKKLWKAALVVAIVIAFSRMYLYVHYPTDILGGIVVGIICGAAGAYLVRFINEMRSYEKQ